MNRDWQQDRELAHKARYEYSLTYLNPVLDALFYWLQQYAEWKAKAYELEVRNHEMLKVLEQIKSDIDEFRSYIDVEACETVEDQAKAFNELLKAEKKRADRAEEELAKSRAERKQFNQVYRLLLKKYKAAETELMESKGKE